MKIESIIPKDMGESDISSVIDKCNETILMYSEEVDRYNNTMIILNSVYHSQDAAHRIKIDFLNKLVNGMNKKVNNGLNILSDIVEFHSYNPESYNETIIDLAIFETRTITQLSIRDLTYTNAIKSVSDILNGDSYKN
ncbi:MAG: hypothetical protein ABH828_02255 [archaeon]